MGKGGSCSLQIPLLIAELSSELWWGAQRKLQSLLSRKGNDHMAGWLEQGAGDKGKMLFGTQGLLWGGHRADLGVLQAMFKPCRMLSCLF